MEWSTRYQHAKAALLEDSGICQENRALFAEFYAFEEYKLKRRNGLPELDDGCFKTLYGYLQLLRNANAWFGNKPWKGLTKEEIKRVYDGLEDGSIRSRTGGPFQNRSAYYCKVFKGKPFRIAGQAERAREVIEFSAPVRRVVRFVTEDAFRTLVSVVANPAQLLLLWLAWDIGENVNTLLKLTPQDFTAQSNRTTGEREYLVNLPTSKIKRSRQTRSEVTLYPETVRYADIVLGQTTRDQRVFRFEYRQAHQFLGSASRRSGAKSRPLDEPIRWKDLRSGMACHLLRHGWTRDEVNARLGHLPHSPVLNSYINLLALDREKPKQRLITSRSESLQAELDAAKQAGHLAGERLKQQEAESQVLRQEIVRTRGDIDELRTELRELVEALSVRARCTAGEKLRRRVGSCRHGTPGSAMAEPGRSVRGPAQDA